VEGSQISGGAENNGHTVDRIQRYSAAAQETSTRIQARDHAVEGFVTLASALITASLVKESLAFVSVGIGYIALADFGMGGGNEKHLSLVRTGNLGSRASSTAKSLLNTATVTAPNGTYSRSWMRS
jgi:hypothetical protein